MTGFASVEGHNATRVQVHVPHTGPWFADLDMEGDPALSGGVTLKLGDLELVGTVRARNDGTHGLQRQTRIVAGNDGWGSLLAAKSYHNDASVKARTVADDAARSAGEVIGDFAPERQRLGLHYVRQAGPASRTLEEVIGAVSWWVDYDGVTQVGARPESSPEDDSYEVLDYHPRDRLVVLGVDDLRQVGIGSLLAGDRLDDPQTVRELDIEVTEESLRVHAWCGGQDGAPGRLTGIMRAIAQRATDGALHGLWRYRVVQMAGDGDRVELQAMSQQAGLPDVLPVSQFPGLAGAHADLTPGAEVLVQFVEGSRSRPVVTQFVGRGGAGHVPVRVILSGSNSAPNAAREGDAVRVTIPTGTFLVSAQNGSLNPDPVDVDGEIIEGSDKVGIG